MKRLAAILGSVVLGLSAPAAAATVPGTTWSRVAPTKAGLDAKRLSRIATTARVGKSQLPGRDPQRQDRRRVGVQQHEPRLDPERVLGDQVGDQHAGGDRAGRRRPDIDDSASNCIPEWRATPAAAVTVRDLMANDSGRAWSVVIDYAQLLSAPDET